MHAYCDKNQFFRIFRCFSWSSKYQKSWVSFAILFLFLFRRVFAWLGLSFAQSDLGLKQFHLSSFLGKFFLNGFDLGLSVIIARISFFDLDWNLALLFGLIGGKNLFQFNLDLFCLFGRWYFLEIRWRWLIIEASQKILISLRKSQ